MKAYDGEDVWSFEGDIVDGFLTLLSFGIAGDNVLRNTLELLESKAHTALIEGHSRVTRKNPGMIENLHFLH